MTPRENILYTIIIMQTIIIIFNNIAHEFLKTNNYFLGFVLIILALTMSVLVLIFNKIITGVEQVEYKHNN